MELLGDKRYLPRAQGLIHWAEQNLKDHQLATTPSLKGHFSWVNVAAACEPPGRSGTLPLRSGRWPCPEGGMGVVRSTLLWPVPEPAQLVKPYRDCCWNTLMWSSAPVLSLAGFLPFLSFSFPQSDTKLSESVLYLAQFLASCLSTATVEHAHMIITAGPPPTHTPTPSHLHSLLYLQKVLERTFLY